MREWVSIRKVSTDFSMRSTQLRVAVWGSAYPSVAPSSRVTMAVYGQHRMMVREPRFHFLFLGAPRVWRAPAVLAPFGRLLRRMRSMSLGIRDGHAFTRIGRR